LQLRHFLFLLRREKEARLGELLSAGSVPGALAEALTGLLPNEGRLCFESETVLQLFESIPVAISVTAGPEHRFIYANRHYREAIFPEIDLSGREHASAFGRRLGARNYDMRNLAYAGRRARSANETPVAAGGKASETFWDVTYFPILDEAGASCGILTFAIDVTEKVAARRQAEARALEQAVRAEEASFDRARLALAVEATDLGIWEWNVATGEVEWSDRQKEIWGLSQDAEVSYETWRSSIHPQDAERVLAQVQRTLDPASGGEQRMEHRIVRPGGGIRWISSRGRMLFDEASRRPVRLIGTTLDVTSRKRAEAELQTALDAKEVLLDEVNHRVKNSLQLVSAMLALQSGQSAEAEVRRVVRDAQARLQIVAAVHERLHRSEDIRFVDLAAFLEGLCRDIERGMQGENAVRVEVSAEPLTIGNDRAVPLALILNELLTNAIKYAYPDGRGVVRVRLETRAGGSAFLSVSDDGSGLPADFETRRNRSLGFRIIERLAQQMRGQFRVVEQASGAGFEIAFEAETAS
jgi:PAS domain S-box-containing protein